VTILLEFVIGNSTRFETKAVGLTKPVGFTTVTKTVPSLVVSEAGSRAVSWVGLLDVGVSWIDVAAPSRLTSITDPFEPDMKLTPLMVSETEPPPVAVATGEMLSI